MSIEFYNKDKINALINYIVLANCSYFLTYSNYTLKIECELLSINITYVEKKRSGSFFANCKAIKKEVIKKQVPNIDRRTINYNNFSSKLKDGMYFDNLICIDINSAYPQALKNNNFVSNEFFNKLQSLDKSDKLAVIGSLASNKKQYEFKGKELIELQEIKSIYYNYFFFCVKTIGDLLQKISIIFDDCFLFYWVDGIYFKPEFKNEKKVIDYFNKNNYQCKKVLVKNFKINEKRITFWEERKNDCIKKNYSIPNSTRFNKDIEILYNL